MVLEKLVSQECSSAATDDCCTEAAFSVVASLALRVGISGVVLIVLAPFRLWNAVLRVGRIVVFIPDCFWVVGFPW
jgi:hypothetical protein